jgi:hypothetical protein
MLPVQMQGWNSGLSALPSHRHTRHMSPAITFAAQLLRTGTTNLHRYDKIRTIYCKKENTIKETRCSKAPLIHYCTLSTPETNVTDPDPNPDPPDPHVFGPPGSGSTSQRYGSGSFYHHAKIVRKTLVPTIL